VLRVGWSETFAISHDPKLEGFDLRKRVQRDSKGSVVLAFPKSSTTSLAERLGR